MVSYIPKSCPFLISLSAFFVILMEDMEDNKIEEVLEVKFMLAAKIITEKNFNRARVRSILYKSWMNVKLHIADLSPHLYLISFIAEEDMQKILTESPWSMMGQLVNLKRWEKVIPINNIDFSKTPFWIQIHGLSEDQLTLKNAQDIGEFLGGVLGAENPMEGGLVRRNFLRVRVMIDLQEPLVAGLWSPIPGNTNSWLDLKYEKLSRFCYKCGLIGHAAKNCTDIVAMSTIDPELPRYGPRLRASPETTLVMTTQHTMKILGRKAETQSMWHPPYSIDRVKQGIIRMLVKLILKLAPDAKGAPKEALTYGDLASTTKGSSPKEACTFTYGKPAFASKDGAPIPNEAHTFTLRELKVATRNFRADLILGEGSLGQVYKGILERTDQVVAIKHLSFNIIQGKREFINEVLNLSLLQHPNLVKLIGYCIEDHQRFMVYEYMPLGSLKNHLHDLIPDRRPLDWNTRMKVAAGIAKALGYLHNKANPIHGGLKSSDILLGEGYHPKLSYYGLSRPIALLGISFVEKSYEHWAPEYQRTGQFTLKSDIYSFGVVLLEIFTGRKPIDNSRGFSEKDLVAWARSMFKDRRKFKKMVDPLLEGQYPVGGLYQLLDVAAMCLQEQDLMRPVIDDVITSMNDLASKFYVPKTVSSWI